MNAVEQSALSENEAVIERGLATFVEVGTALMDIRDRRLYREQYATFEDYCERRWEMSRPRAYQLISAAETVRNVSTIVDTTPPQNEAQARPLAILQPEMQRTAWNMVEQTAPNGIITAAHVRSIVNVLNDVLRTRAIDNGDGEDIPIEAAQLDHLKAAVTEETYERMMRQEIHIAGQNNPALFTSKSPEWYTPDDLMHYVRIVLGVIHLDPASNEAANTIVRARHYFDRSADGLSSAWEAKTVYLNPPYGREIDRWIDKLLSEYQDRNFEQAIALLPARVDTEWFGKLREYPRCFVRGRVRFWTENDPDPSGATFPSVVIYLGNNLALFARTFAQIGDVYTLWHL